MRNRESKGANGDDAERGATGVSHGMEWRAVVTQQHKLVMRYDGAVAALFDREKDPYEMNNLAEERSASALRDDLQAKLKQRGADTGDRFPQMTPPAKASYPDSVSDRQVTFGTRGAGW